jgi:Uma2 family endonuclease
MVAKPTSPLVRALADREQRIVLLGVPWKTYAVLRDAIDEPYVKMTYCEGVLELMSPSGAHERAKKFAARLVELYAFLTRTPLYAYGSTTFRSEAKARGVEPDECYRFGSELEEGQFPDLVIEVIEASPLLDKLAVYDGLAVPEVWLLEKGELRIFERRAKGGYRRARRSRFVPDLDPTLIERYVDAKDQDEAIHAFAAHFAGAKSAKKKARGAQRRSRG